MSNRLSVLNGTDWSDGQVLTSADLIDTFEASLNASAVLVAQSAYQILQANDVFVNRDLLFADEFTDSTGTNNTINTSSSDAVFSTNKYICKGGIGAYASSDLIADTGTILLNGDETYLALYVDGLIYSGTGDGSNDTDTGATFDATDSTTSKLGYTISVLDTCVLTVVTKGSNTTTTTAYLLDENDLELERATFSGTTATFSGESILEQGKTYKIVADSAGASYTRDRTSSPSYPYAGSNVSFTGREDGTTGTAFNIQSITTQDLTSKTSMVSIDVTDGTTTLTNQAITNNRTSFIDISSFVAGSQLKVTFNLTPANVNITPFLYGYGGAMFR